MLDIAGNGAVLSECKTFRYRLDRHVGEGDIVAAVIGVNPSTADASLDDQTVRKWRGFGQRLGWQRFIVGNVFSLRATNVREVAHAPDPFGPDHRKYLDGIIDEADIIVPCWGDRAKLPRMLRPRLDDMMEVLRLTGRPLFCWGLTASGDPKHPMMLAYDTPLIAIQ
ncbi:DUF1643 domain-containing protein [Epibacterium sp. DP7N7-1]|nr:DUF1643 domain-containing protein [Epibacterium sp. DP7N7-1]